MSFLSSLKSILSSEEENRAFEAGNPNFITQASRIKHALQILMESHVHISIVLDDESEHTTRLIGVSNNDLLLDQLNNREAHNKMRSAKGIQVLAKRSAIPFNFNSRVLSLAKGGGYFISLPEKIYHPQKRDFFRIPLENIEKYKFSASLQYSENTLTGHIIDASFGGICVAVYANCYVKKGDILSSASMVLKNGDTINSDFTVCTVKKAHQDGFTRLGCQFLNIEPAEKKNLHKFITESSREHAKKP